MVYLSWSNFYSLTNIFNPNKVSRFDLIKRYLLFLLLSTAHLALSTSFALPHAMPLPSAFPCASLVDFHGFTLLVSVSALRKMNKALLTGKSFRSLEICQDYTRSLTRKSTRESISVENECAILSHLRSTRALHEITCFFTQSRNIQMHQAWAALQQPLLQYSSACGAWR